MLSRVNLENLEPGGNNIYQTNALLKSQVPLLDPIGSSTVEPIDGPSRTLNEGGYQEVWTEMGSGPGPNLNSLLPTVIYSCFQKMGYGNVVSG